MSAAPKEVRNIRKRELCRAIAKLKEIIKIHQGTLDGYRVYGLRAAVTALIKMRKEIDHE